MTAAVPSSSAEQTDSLHNAFLSHLPGIEYQARFHFRYLRCLHRREDAVAETIALAWFWFVAFSQRGKDPSSFITVLANLAARSVKSGRRLCGMEKGKDVLSPRAQHKRGFAVESFVDGAPGGNPYKTALRDNTWTPVPEQVAFRCDFPDWRTSLCERDRQLVDLLVLGERTQDVAQKFGLTPGRVSQLRRRFHSDWQVFCQEPSGQPSAVPV